MDKISLNGLTFSLNSVKFEGKGFNKKNTGSLSELKNYELFDLYNLALLWLVSNKIYPCWIKYLLRMTAPTNKLIVTQMKVDKRYNRNYDGLILEMNIILNCTRWTRVLNL